MERMQRAWLSWAVIGLLAVLCAFLALLQNRWIDELARAEKIRLQQELQTELNRLSGEFNANISAECAALLPSEAEVERAGREKAYALHYARWRDSHDRLFSAIALAVPREDQLDLFKLNLDTAQFSLAPWPAPWLEVRDQLLAHRKGGGFGPARSENPLLIDLPRFANFSKEPGLRQGEKDWLIVELDPSYLRDIVLPGLLQRHFGARGKPSYRAELVPVSNPNHVIFRFGPGPEERTARPPDASVNLLQIDYNSLRMQGSPRPFHEREGRMGWRFPFPPQPPDGGQGSLLLMVRHQAGSLETVVATARRQNVLISAGVLLLILTTVVTLVRLSRKAQHLAELQMNFVAGVSHELRTPLTVIRTAAFNLRGKIASRPEQVERYGELIQNESEKLGALVEQILRFASSRAGYVIREREPVSIEAVVEEGIRSSSAGLAGAHLVFEKHFEPDLPLVLADELAVKHVIQNLVDNALKYGTEGTNWIGVSVKAVRDHAANMVEIRVADRGPGIPLDEQQHIFDPFFRGRRAVQDQVHGAGLGLNLVKKIVEAHGGTIRCESEPMKGTEFVVRIPATVETQDEFAHSVG